MKKLAAALALSVTFLAAPSGATGPYKLDLLVDIYGVLDRCAPLDTYYEKLRQNVLDELKAEGYTKSQLAGVQRFDPNGGLNLAKCDSLVQLLIATYLAIPDSSRPPSGRDPIVGNLRL